MTNNFNIANRLVEIAKQLPDKNAITECRKNGNHSLTFAELNRDSDNIAEAMQLDGIGKGMRIALFVRYGIDFVSLFFALLKTGATTVLIDPGMGIRRMLICLAEIEPDGIVGVPAVHFVRLLMKHKFPKAKHNLTVGNRWLWKGMSLDKIRKQTQNPNQNNNQPPQTTKTNPDDIAAIIFTSGSTGSPKGVEFTHRIFDTQVNEIANHYGIKQDDVDLACFPFFGLFDPAMGVTAIIPNIDPTKPAKADPAKLIKIANEHKITQAFASPAIWNRIGDYCNKMKNCPENKPDNCPNKNINTKEKSTCSIPTLVRAISAGAPVSAAILQKLKPFIHPQGEIFTPYGATESLPTASINATEILNDTINKTNLGKGVCVGKKFPSISWTIIKITDEPIPSFESATILQNESIGELVVTGLQVTKNYFNRPEANKLAKMIDQKNQIWHRMGDVGYLDQNDRFWFCGRKSHRVETKEGTLFTIPCESIFNQHKLVFRSALANSPNGIPRIFIEPIQDKFPKTKKEKNKLIDELLELGQQNNITKQIKEIRILHKFPVDIRHNVKINRELLSTLR
ncbi:MAG: AMP-binding protein [Planctomycetaceae bacterium]|jgi:acyl-CoA synthetase (AMP-forming)/AMP-acid ligase II|nr:AMP-binding protein [Planctomycetaceae bacterium]